MLGDLFISYINALVIHDAGKIITLQSKGDTINGTNYMAEDLIIYIYIS